MRSQPPPGASGSTGLALYALPYRVVDEMLAATPPAVWSRLVTSAPVLSYHPRWIAQKTVIYPIEALRKIRRRVQRRAACKRNKQNRKDDAGVPWWCGGGGGW